MSDNETHNPDKIIQEANVKFESGDLSGAQMTYQSALLEWVDEAQFGSPSQQLLDSIASLWISYANLNQKANQMKAATEAFESAVNCPVAGNIGSVWIAYANYQASRNRHKTAQKIYIRALVGENGMGPKVVKEQDRTQLWDNFLNMMHEVGGNNCLSLEQLKDAVKAEHGTDGDGFTVSSVSVKAEEQVTDLYNDTYQIDQVQSVVSNVITEEPVLKRAKIMDSTRPSFSVASVESYANELLTKIKTLPAENTAEWLALDGTSFPFIPTPLFSPSPPRLSDPSGTELLGSDIALKLIRLLIGGNGKSDKYCGRSILEICEACWLMTGLKEKEAAKMTEALDKKLEDDVKKMETDLDARLSVAGAAAIAVQQMNANEKNAFIASCNSQRQHLQALIAWEFRHLMASQQMILTNAGLPEFNGPTINGTSIYKQTAICSFLHSAFFIRNKIGEDAHINMLKSQEVRLRDQSPTAMPMPIPSQNQQYNYVQ